LTETPLLIDKKYFSRTTALARTCSTHSSFGEIEKKFVEPLDGEIVKHDTQRADDYVQVGVRNWTHVYEHVICSQYNYISTTTETFTKYTAI